MLQFNETIIDENGSEIQLTVCEPVLENQENRMLQITLDDKDGAIISQLVDVESAISIRAVIDDFIERASLNYEIK